MEVSHSGKIQRVSHRHTPEVSKQTGFPSAATHYMEAPIDLNQELTHTKEATFYVRVSGNHWKQYQIYEDDVLIIDRSLYPKPSSLILVVAAGEFLIKRVDTVNEPYTLWGVITYVIHKVL